MFAVVRKFSIQHNGQWHKVLYVYQGSAGTTGYFVEGSDRSSLSIPHSEVTGMRSDEQELELE
jgi:hypothetical protein